MASQNSSPRKSSNGGVGRVWLQVLICIVCTVIVVVFLIVLFTQTGKEQTIQEYNVATPVAQVDVATETATTEEPTQPPFIYPKNASGYRALDYNNITAQYAILYDVEANEIVAGRAADEFFYPASMTKIMTLLVAVENVDDLQDTFTMTYDIIAPLIEEDASRAGFSEGETVTIADLLYGVVLPSGADATVGLATYICGSEEAFVDLMNDKVAELGLENTHFMNTSGLQDEEHYTTATDMAILMAAVMDNPTCREVLGTYQYRTSETEEHPDGILLESTMYSRMYGTEVEGMTIEGGKTGYTDEARHCLVSYAVDEETGEHYVAVVAYDTTYWRAIFDTFALYGLVSGGYDMPEDLEPTDWDNIEEEDEEDEYAE